MVTSQDDTSLDIARLFLTQQVTGAAIIPSHSQYSPRQDLVGN